MSLFWVVGGEYTDTHFQETVGSNEEWFGPFRDYEGSRLRAAKSWLPYFSRLIPLSL